MVRSYTCALAFVFARLYQVIPMEFIFGIIDDPTVKRVVIEWMFSILPLIIVEIAIIWIPSIQTAPIINNKVR